MNSGYKIIFLQVWESFEGRWQNFESLLTGIEERAKHLDFVVRNKDHVFTTKKNIEVRNNRAQVSSFDICEIFCRNYNLKQKP